MVDQWKIDSLSESGFGLSPKSILKDLRWKRLNRATCVL